MSYFRTFQVIAASLALSASALAPAFAQGTSTLRNPLIPGAQSTGPGIPAADGMPPPVGSGPTPVGVNPGMTGDPTLEPWVPSIPANSINEANSGVSLPVTPAVESPPGVLGPALTGFVPPAPSTPGADPGMLQVPPASTNTFNPAQQVGLDPNGGLPGTGGYNSSIPNARRGGQSVMQYERRGLDVAYGAGSGAKGHIQDNLARFGPLAGAGIVDGVPNGTEFARHGGSKGLRISAIDLGGGQRLKFGGVKISTGSSLQDYGLSDTRHNSIAALRAHRSTEFGQGRHDAQSPYSSNTTDFGGNFKQFSPANETPQKLDQLLPPKGVETDQ